MPGAPGAAGRTDGIDGLGPLIDGGGWTVMDTSGQSAVAALSVVRCSQCINGVAGIFKAWCLGVNAFGGFRVT